MTPPEHFTISLNFGYFDFIKHNINSEFSLKILVELFMLKFYFLNI